MSVDDHGLETLKKSASEIVPGDKSEYFHKVLDGWIFMRPRNRVFRTVISDTTDQYFFVWWNGSTHITKYKIEVTYTDVTHDEFVSAEWVD